MSILIFGNSIELSKILCGLNKYKHPVDSKCVAVIERFPTLNSERKEGDRLKIKSIKLTNQYGGHEICELECNVNDGEIIIDKASVWCKKSNSTVSGNKCSMGMCTNNETFNNYFK